VEIVVFAKVFRKGNWEISEHRCSDEDVDAVEDSARAYAQNRLSVHPLPIDYLQAAKYVFEVACGPEDKPKEGDTRVHGVSVNAILIEVRDESSQSSHEPKKVA